MNLGTNLHYVFTPLRPLIGADSSVLRVRLSGSCIYTVMDDSNRSFVVDFAFTIQVLHERLIQRLLQGRTELDFPTVLNYAWSYYQATVRLGEPDTKFFEIVVKNGIVTATFRPRHPQDFVLSDVQTGKYVFVSFSQSDAPEDVQVYMVPRKLAEEPLTIGTAMIGVNWVRNTRYYGQEPISEWKPGGYWP